MTALIKCHLCGLHYELNLLPGPLAFQLFAELKRPDGHQRPRAEAESLVTDLR